MAFNSRLEPLDDEKLNSAIKKAERFLGVKASEKAKEKLKDPSEIQRIIKSLSSSDISAIESAIRNTGSIDSIIKDKKTLDKIKSILGE